MCAGNLPSWILPLLGILFITFLDLFLIKKITWLREHKSLVLIISVFLGLLWVLVSLSLSLTFC